MDKSQELISLFAIFIALIPLAKCGSFVTVTEDEAVQLEFPYPCDSNKVTIQSANRLPFYNSARPENLNLPFYQLNRFSVTNENCSVQVDINPVKRSDEATYIRQEYKDGAIQSEFIRIRLNVHYPPGDVSCTFIITDDAVGDWVPLQCTAPIGSLAGGINCYQDSARLPPMSKLGQTGETLIQTIWAKKEYPVFCCSHILDQPKDKCECKDFVWDSMKDISHTKNILDPCPATTPGPVATLPQYPEREVGDNPQVPKLIESLKLTNTNKEKQTANNVAVLWGCVIVIGIVVIAMVIILLIQYVVEKTKSFHKKVRVQTYTMPDWVDKDKSTANNSTILWVHWVDVTVIVIVIIIQVIIYNNASISMWLREPKSFLSYQFTKELHVLSRNKK